jgi:hypothetical protein
MSPYLTVIVHRNVQKYTLDPIPEGGQMDHKEQHHLRHVKEREEEKKERHEHEREAEKTRLPFHPAWLFVAGATLVLAAMLVWLVVA